LSLTSLKYGFGIRDPEKTYSGSRIWVQGSNRHRIPDPGSAADSNSIPGINFYSLNPSKNLSSGMRKGKRKGIYNIELEVLTSSWSRDN
jgi:hypothetical protein